MKMKHVYQIISCLVLFMMVESDLFAQKDFFGMQTITVSDQEFVLRWSAKTRNDRYMEEFLLPSENFAGFIQKVTIECSQENKSVEDEMRELMAKLAVKKEQNIVFSFEQIDSPVEGEIWIEYVQGNVQGGQSFTMEWNLNRYCLVNNRVVLFRVIHRAYDKELNDFMKIINKKRDKWIKDAASFQMETVKVKK